MRNRRFVSLCFRLLNTSTDEEIDDTCDQTNPADHTGDQLKFCNFAFLQMLPIGWDVFRCHLMCHVVMNQIKLFGGSLKCTDVGHDGPAIPHGKIVLVATHQALAV